MNFNFFDSLYGMPEPNGPGGWAYSVLCPAGINALSALGIPPRFWAIIAAILPIVIIWSLIWKGLALWKAARMESKPWFVVLLIVNTLGILEILYLFVFSKRSSAVSTQPTQQQ